MTHVENKLQGCFQWSNMSISVPMPLGSTRTEVVKTEMTKKSLKSMKEKFFTFVSLGLLPPPFPLRGSRHSEGAPLLVFHRLWPGRRVRGSWSLWLVAAWWRTLLTCCLYITICYTCILKHSSNPYLEVGKLLMMPGCWQKGKGELVHGQGQPIKCARQRVTQVFLTRGDVHVFCVGQHERRQEVATHLANKEAQNLNVPKKDKRTSSLLQPPTMLVKSLKFPSSSRSGSSPRIWEPRWATWQFRQA